MALALVEGNETIDGDKLFALALDEEKGYGIDTTDEVSLKLGSLLLHREKNLKVLKSS